MKLIMGSLLIMFILVILTVILGGTYLTTTDTIIIDSEALIDGETATFEATTGIFTIGIDSLEGLVIILTAVIVIASLVGIQVLGSGLSDSAVRTVTIVSVYAELWLILSLMVNSLVWSIEIFGTLIYILLTIIYSIGVIQKITG